MITSRPIRKKCQTQQCLSKQDINMYGSSFLSTHQQLSPKKCSELPTNILIFMLKCITDIIKTNTCIKFTPKQKETLYYMFYPHKKEFKLLSRPSMRASNIKTIKNQSGQGIILSSLIASVVPLISSLISKMLRKK